MLENNSPTNKLNKDDTPQGKTFRRYIFDNIPNSFRQSNSWHQSISNLIVDLEYQIDNQASINQSYSKLCEILFNEMDKNLKYKTCGKPVKKQLKNSKPFWCEELDDLWKNLREKEKRYNGKQLTTNLRKKYRTDFKNAQNIFDKRLRQVERQYNHNKIIQIEQVCTSNPRAFWNQIKNLGPRSNNKIPNKVRDPEGNITTDPEFVLDKWKTEFGIYTIILIRRILIMIIYLNLKPS